MLMGCHRLHLVVGGVLTICFTIAWTQMSWECGRWQVLSFHLLSKVSITENSFKITH